MAMRGPKTLVCYICGRQFGTSSLEIHLKTCKKMFLQNEEKKPRHLRKPLPEEPSDLSAIASGGRAAIDAHNDAAYKAAQDMLEPCPNCGRTFNPERLPIHLRSCRPGATAKPVGAPGLGGAGAPMHPDILARSGHTEPGMSGAVAGKFRHSSGSGSTRDGDGRPSTAHAAPERPRSARSRTPERRRSTTPERGGSGGGGGGGGSGRGGHGHAPHRHREAHSSGGSGDAGSAPRGILHRRESGGSGAPDLGSTHGSGYLSSHLPGIDPHEGSGAGGGGGTGHHHAGSGGSGGAEPAELFPEALHGAGAVRGSGNARLVGVIEAHVANLEGQMAAMQAEVDSMKALLASLKDNIV